MQSSAASGRVVSTESTWGGAMKHFNAGKLGLAAALAASAYAHAGDIYNAPAASLKDSPYYLGPVWQGWYVGVNGGYGWRAKSDQFAYSSGSGTEGSLFGTGSYAGYGGIGADGGFGGGQIGYNWQGLFGRSAAVFSMEADIQGAGIDGSGVDTTGDVARTRLEWFGTIRARLGYAFNNTLLYGTGGFAYGGLNSRASDNSVNDDGTVANYRFSGTVTGYVLGAGIEYKVSPAWSLKAEYQYLDFGKHDLPAVSGIESGVTPLSAQADAFAIHNDAYHTVRIGLNYSFQPIYVPLK